MDELVEPILEHFRSVICSNNEQLEFHLAWMAQQVQDPAHKTGVGIIYLGEQGVGKDIVTGWFANDVLGKNVAIQCGDTAPIFGTHAVGLQSKVLCVLDEADAGSLKPHIPLLKASMTSDTLDFNPKNKAPYKVQSLVNFWFTSNTQNPIPLEASDRRFVAFECNNSKKGDNDYFTTLGQRLNNRSARAFFQYLQKVDLRDYCNFQAKRPETEMYHRLKQMNIPMFHTFLSSQCFENPDPEAESCEKAKSMFQQLQAWADSSNFSHRSYTMTSFGRDFSDLMSKYSDHGVEKKRTGQGFRYAIKWRKLEECLKENNLFSHDAM